MKKVVVALAVALVLAVVAVVVSIGGPRGPSLSTVEHFKEPRTTTMSASNMLVVTAKGDPNVVGRRAFGLLMRTYYGLSGVPKGPGMPAPRARWPVGVATPREQWIGHYAMPVPAGASLPNTMKTDDGLTVQLATWEYGDVAEILHVGRYDAEMPTVERLEGFIADRSCEVVGDHEEEYLRGPGMWFAGNPDTYLTLIRYRIRPKPVVP